MKTEFEPVPPPSPQSQELIKIIKELSLSLQTNSQTTQQTEAFLSLASGRKRLPSGDSPNSGITEQFILIIMTLISMKNDISTNTRAINILTTYLINDSTVFNLLSVTKPLIRKLNFEAHMASQNQQERDAATELALFFLRYHRQIDYTDFSTDANIVQRLRREQEYKFWKNLDSVNAEQLALSRQLENLKNGSFNAFEEIGKGLGQPAIEDVIMRLRAELEQKFVQVKRERDDLKHENYQQLQDQTEKLRRYVDLKLQDQDSRDAKQDSKIESIIQDNSGKLLKIMLEVDEKIQVQQTQLERNLKSLLKSVVDQLDDSKGLESKMNSRIDAIDEKYRLQNMNLAHQLESFRNEKESSKVQRNRESDVQAVMDKLTKSLVALQMEQAKFEQRIQLADDLYQQKVVNLTKLFQTSDERQDKQLLQLRQTADESQHTLNSDLANHQKQVFQFILDIEKKTELSIKELTAKTQQDMIAFIQQLDLKKTVKDLEERTQSTIKKEESRAKEHEKAIHEQLSDFIREVQRQIDNQMQKRLQESSSEHEAVLKKLAVSTQEQIQETQKLMEQAYQNSQKTWIAQYDRQRVEFNNKLQTQAAQSTQESTKSLELALAQLKKESENMVQAKMIEILEQISKFVDSKLGLKSNELTHNIDDKVQSQSSAFIKMLDEKIHDILNIVEENITKRIQNLKTTFDQSLESQLQDVQSKSRTFTVNQIKDCEVFTERLMDKNLNALQLQITRQLTDSVRDSSDILKHLIEQRLQELQGSNGRLLEQTLLDSKNLIGQIIEKKIGETVNLLTRKIDSKAAEVESSITLQTDRKIQILKSDNSLKMYIEQWSQEFQLQNTHNLQEAQKTTLAAVQSSFEGQRTDLLRSLEDKFKRETEIMHQESKLRVSEMDTTLNREIKGAIAAIQQRLDESENRAIRSVDVKVRDLNQDLGSKCQYAVELAQQTQKNCQISISDCKDEVEQKVGNINKIVTLLKSEIEVEMDRNAIKQTKFLTQILTKQVEEQIFKATEKQNLEIQLIKQTANSNKLEIAEQKKVTESNSEKVVRMEKATRDQHTLIANINYTVGHTEQTIKNGDQQLERRIDEIQKQFSKFNDWEGKTKELNNKQDLLKNQFAIIQQACTENVKSQNELKDQVRDQVQPKIDILLNYKLESTQKIENLSASIVQFNAELHSQFEQQQSRHSNAFALLDVKQTQMGEKLRMVEEEIRLQIERSLKELTSSDMARQKDLADLNEEIHNLTSQFVEYKRQVLSALDQHSAKMNENLENLKNDVEKSFLNLNTEIQLVYGQINVINQRLAEIKDVLKIQEDLQTSLKVVSSLTYQIDGEVTELKNQNIKTRQEMETIITALTEMDRLGHLVDEANKLWIFFQKFIDEQGIDQLKIIRSGDTEISQKLQSVEWIIRYIEYVTPDTTALCVKAFKDNLYAGKGREEGNKYVEHIHHSESIPTCLQNLRNLKVKIEQQLVSVDTYDLHNSMLLMALEPLLVNNLNLDMVLKLGGMTDICRIMMEQPVPSEVNTKQTNIFQYNSKFVNGSFRHALRCVATSLRNERGVIEFLANPKWIVRVLLITEEWEEKDIILITCRIIGRVAAEDTTFDRFISGYPNLGNFLLQILDQYQDHELVVNEVVFGVKNITRKQSYHSNINPKEIKILYKILTKYRNRAVQIQIAETLANMNKTSALKWEIDKNGGVPKQN